jgi:hypothetical protein
MRKRYASTQLHEQLLGAGERDHARAPRGQLSLQSIERTGLHLQEFSAIAELCALDPGLRARVADKVMERRRI